MLTVRVAIVAAQLLPPVPCCQSLSFTTFVHQIRPSPPPVTSAHHLALEACVYRRRRSLGARTVYLKPDLEERGLPGAEPDILEPSIGNDFNPGKPSIFNFNAHHLVRKTTCSIAHHQVPMTSCSIEVCPIHVAHDLSPPSLPSEFVCVEDGARRLPEARGA